MRHADKFILTFGALFMIFVVLCLRPVPIVAEEDSLMVSGTVASIGIGGVQDVVIKLKEDKTVYYINRGYENGLDQQSLRDELIGQQVTLKYPDYWTPLDMDNSIRHISKLEHGEKVLFNELK